MRVDMHITVCLVTVIIASTPAKSDPWDAQPARLVEPRGEYI